MSIAASPEAASPEVETISIDKIRIRRALISVSDKTGLADLASVLTKFGAVLYSTGGTEQFLKAQGYEVHSVADLTKFPEMMDGRLKTLHPMVHGGLLFRRDLRTHATEAAEHGIMPIDLLVVNLYPFEDTVRRAGATSAEIIEQIDIGGPAMLRSAAKNFQGVALLTSPAQYGHFAEEFDRNEGDIGLSTRLNLARDAFDHVARYDDAIARYFNKLTSTIALDGDGFGEPVLRVDQPLVQPLRYGENPQQKAALFGSDFSRIYKQVWGKELSYNNILDISAATQLILEFSNTTKPVAAIIKHTNPCGVAEGDDALDAFNRAFASDPESPFGGIIILTDPVTRAVAERLNEFFSEVILAPYFDGEAIEVLHKKRDRRLLVYHMKEAKRALDSATELRTVLGGVLQQEPDRELFTDSSMTSITSRKVSDEERNGLLFAWKVCKHVKSNAIVYAGTENGHARTLGIGCGQTSRVESSRLAVSRAAQFGLSLEGSLVASDAFFPFADGLVESANAGAIAAIQPGGSVRDQEVIAAAESKGMSLIMTGMRHFRH